MGACIVLLTWSREERSEWFRDPCDVRIIVPFVRWNDGFKTSTMEEIRL